MGIVKFSSRDYLTYVPVLLRSGHERARCFVCLSVCQIRDIDLYEVSCFALGIRIAKIDYARYIYLESSQANVSSLRKGIDRRNFTAQQPSTTLLP